MTTVSDLQEIRNNKIVMKYTASMMLFLTVTLFITCLTPACAPQSVTKNGTPPVKQATTATTEPQASSTRELLNQPDTAQTAATGTQPTTYVNTDYGFSVVIPPGWTVKLVDNGINVNPAAGWAAISITKGEGPAARAAIYLEDVSAYSVTNKTFYYRTDATGICPKPWYMYYWMDRSNNQGSLNHQEILLREAGDHYFMFLTTALTEEYDSYPFKDVAASFKLLGE